jgi:hypothetical protein
VGAGESIQLDRVVSGIGSWMNFYNFRRPHQAMNNQTPMAVWRAGLDKIEAAAGAVDMPLRLDNANALTTYPQQRQKQQKRCRRALTLGPPSPTIAAASGSRSITRPSIV